MVPNVFYSFLPPPGRAVVEPPAAGEVQSKAKQSKAKQSKAKRSEAKRSEAKRSEAKRSKAKQSKAKQSKATQSKAKQSKASHNKLGRAGQPGSAQGVSTTHSVEPESMARGGPPNTLPLR